MSRNYIKYMHTVSHAFVTVCDCDCIVCECTHNISSHARPKNIVTTAINAATEYVGAASKSPLEQSIFKPEPSTERHVSAGINESTDVPVQSEFVYTFD